MSGRVISGEPWTAEQQALVRTLATRAKSSTILARLALIGPPRTYAALSAWASRNRVSLRVHRNYKLPERNRRREWCEDEDAVLRILAGTRRPKELAEAVNRKLGTRRTGAAVRNRARLLSVSLAPRGRLGMNDMVRIFPAHNRTVARWVDEGLLRAEQRGAGRKGAEWWFRVQDVEAFVRDHVYLFAEWRRVEAGRWRDLVRVAQLRTPYLSCDEAARRLGTRVANVHRWCRRGRVPGLERLDVGASGRFRIPLAALDILGRLIRPSIRKEGAA
jgi:hypothetical protein